MMDSYRSRRALSAGSIFFIVFFILVSIGAGYLFFIDQGIFWDYALYFCIPVVVINLILMIFYFVKRSISGYIFLLFFLVFLTIIVLSSFLGPFALINSARESYDNEKYGNAITDYKEIIDKYPGSRHAKEASERIAYSYYMSGDYENAMYYFIKAIDENIINGDSLEVKKILADSNLRIAEGYFNQKDFEKASEYYLETSQRLKEIADSFPNTNDAFIADYKIPEYMYQAASSAGFAKLWEKSNEILHNIIEDYPDSEYSEQSKNLLFYNILRNSSELKSNGEDRQSIETFTMIFDLDRELLEQKKSDIDYYIKYLLGDAPATILVQIANEMYYAADYGKAMFIYDYLLENHPQYENTILKNVVGNKIMVVQKSTYETLEASDPVGSFAGEETSRIIIENRTDNALVQYMGGPEYLLLRFEKQSKTEIEIAAGAYKIVVEFDNPDIYPFYGEITYEAGKTYRQVYELKEEENN